MGHHWKITGSCWILTRNHGLIQLWISHLYVHYNNNFLYNINKNMWIIVNQYKSIHTPLPSKILNMIEYVDNQLIRLPIEHYWSSIHTNYNTISHLYIYIHYNNILQYIIIYIYILYHTIIKDPPNPHSPGPWVPGSSNFPVTKFRGAGSSPGCKRCKVSTSKSQRG